MSEMKANVAVHDTHRGLGDRILSALEEAGKDLDALTPDDHAPVRTTPRDHSGLRTVFPPM